MIRAVLRTIKILKKVESDSDKDIFKEFDLKAFLKNHGSRRTKVKSLIMDQRAVAGIGNIYACEILHRTGIHPERVAATLTKDEWKKIFRQAKVVLKTAIKKRGTSISDWRDLYGCKGENQHELKAYGREGKQLFNLRRHNLPDKARRTKHLLLSQIARSNISVSLSEKISPAAVVNTNKNRHAKKGKVACKIKPVNIPRRRPKTAAGNIQTSY